MWWYVSGPCKPHPLRFFSRPKRHKKIKDANAEHRHPRPQSYQSITCKKYRCGAHRTDEGPQQRTRQTKNAAARIRKKDHAREREQFGRKSPNLLCDLTADSSKLQKGYHDATPQIKYRSMSERPFTLASAFHESPYSGSNTQLRFNP